ncbi:exodeoxyribonuclease VII small subunit [Lentisphaerota bacterium ZTH]|nr:exodeoxyribonuclease VII small subunit [Lentisphaerota bacterium]WET05627.1 exodeoxyribonuclease VII small subunit [Lentisphaerota bacterium ZTH]
MTAAQQKNAAIPFEKALEELEEIVDQMEQGDMPLDKMIQHFERGCALSKLCRKKLSNLEKKIELLVKDNGGDGEWEDFDASSERKTAAVKPAEETLSDEEDQEEDLLF